MVRQPAANGCWESRCLSDLALCVCQIFISPVPASVCGCQGMSVLGFALSWAQGSCPSSRRALYVAAEYGGAPSWTRRRWRGEPDLRRVLHWQHRVLVASGVKWHQRPRALSGPRPDSDQPRRALALGAAVGAVATGALAGTGPGSVSAGPMSHNGDACLRKMAERGRDRPCCPRAAYCACALHAVAGRMRTPPRASSGRASREAP